jgi:hypothetical protein
MDKLDLCESIKNHKVSFVLNPDCGWENFPKYIQDIITSNPWYEIKYFVNNTSELNPEVNSVPNDCGGIYSFIIKPNLITGYHLYIAYIGRARCTDFQNLRKRVKEYQTDERLRIQELKQYWGPFLYLRYIPLKEESNATIDAIEKALNKAILPPFNDQYPDTYNQPMRAAF